ncbi:MAG: hypothetical protein ACRD0K_25345 [Egibacteraceae bacterium]
MSRTNSPRARSRAAAMSLLSVAVALLATGCGHNEASPVSPPSLTVGPNTLAPPPIPPQRSTTPPVISAQPEPQRQETPRSVVPDVLVGEWDGGSGPANADYLFTQYGDVGVVYGNRRTEQGTVVVKGNSMTLYLPSGTRTVTWTVEETDTGYEGYKFLTLYMDDASYVRQISEG